MIRLVHQFDDPRARPSVASASCCCCCCCCIATTIGIGVITVKALNSRAAALPPVETTVERPLAHLREPAADVVVTKPSYHPLWLVFGALLVPLAIIVSGLLEYGLAQGLHSDPLGFGGAVAVALLLHLGG